MSGDNLYPAPTLQVFPGETLIVHLDNALTGLTIRTSSIRNTRRRARRCRSIPPQMTSSPLNLHVHGVHVSPKGNADNVMLHIPAGESNTYTYNIPKNMPQGAYWYHSHLHTLTTAARLFGHGGSARDRAHRRQPAAGDAEPDPDPQHGAAIQLRVRSGRRAARSSTTTPGRNGSARSSRRKATSWRRAPTVRCSTPVNFLQLEEGHAVLHHLVLGAAVDPQRARAVRVHPEQSAALHRLPRHGKDRAGRSVACPTTSATCNSPSTASSSR